MESINRTLQIISIQHELAMSIGLDLDLDIMLLKFMERAQQRLSLSCVHVYFEGMDLQYHQQSSVKLNRISYPNVSVKKEHFLDSKITAFLSKPFHEHTEYEFEGCIYYFLPITHFGVLVLERKHAPIEKIILSAIQPLLERLGTSCQACSKHKNLLDEIQARVEIEEQMVKQSLFDSLTKLPNRKMFNINLEKSIMSTRRDSVYGAVLCINIDRFKVINDSLGHVIGDEVLTIVSKRLLECVRKGDCLARVAGDEFMLLVGDLAPEKITALSRAAAVAEKIANLVSLPFDLGGSKLPLSLSTGIVLFPDEDMEITSQSESTKLMHQSNIAMCRVKGDSRNGYCFFNKELQAVSDKRTKIEKLLRTAIQENEFQLYYQPLVQMNGNVIGAEALLRWKNKELPFIGPDEFIPIAEEAGLILDIGRWVIEEACRFILKLSQSKQTGLLQYISVNVSPRQFSQPKFVQDVLQTLQNNEVDPHWIRLEITEGVAIDNIESTIKKMNEFADFGVQCMLDDFGSGYSSLSYLHQLPLKAIKIDRSFIESINEKRDNQIIVDSIIDISDHFSLECVVEGVESEEEYRYLRNKKISAIQGYLFYRPMTCKDFSTVIQEEKQKLAGLSAC